MFTSSGGIIGNQNFSLDTPELNIAPTDTGSNSWVSFSTTTRYLYIMEDYAKYGTGSTAEDVLVKGIKADIAPVPEPGTLVLVGVGLAGMAVYRRKRQNH